MHFIALVNACNLRALSALVSSIGAGLLEGAIPPNSFPLPPIVPPLPQQQQPEAQHQQQATELGLYETRTVGLPPPLQQQQHEVCQRDVTTPPPHLLLTESQLEEWNEQQQQWQRRQQQQQQQQIRYEYQQHLSRYLANFILHIHALFVLPLPGGGAFLLPPNGGAREGGRDSAASTSDAAERQVQQRQQLLVLLEPCRYWQLHLWSALLAVVLQAPQEVALSLQQVPAEVRVAVPLAVKQLRGYAPLMHVIFPDYSEQTPVAP
jgi:hypothetical protein